jgi:hypothetical protein
MVWMDVEISYRAFQGWSIKVGKQHGGLSNQLKVGEITNK